MTLVPKPKSILAVDDNPENLDVVRAALSANYTVKAATNGLLALKIAHSQRPDLILLDIMMPSMDGYEVCRRLKEHPDTRDIPVIFLTARGGVQDETRGFSLGAVDYISKPINAAILHARIQTHIALHEAKRRLEAQNQALIEAARMREDIERVMRHDLKSPLNSIIGTPQLLLMDDNLTLEQREMVKDIEEVGWRMMNMINMSLVLLKMEYGIYEPQLAEVDLLKVLRDVLNDERFWQQGRDIQVHILLNEQPVTAEDQIMMLSEELVCYSMLANLYKNALEASPNGAVITIAFTEHHDTIEIRLCNAGEVPEAIRERFFEKFVTANKPNGTGLGTYSARLIAKALGGAIALDCSQAGYTTVHITLPTTTSKHE